MADSVVQPESVAMPAAEDGSVSLDSTLTGEKGCEGQPVVGADKEEIEAAIERSSSVKESDSIKTGGNGAVQPEKKEQRDDEVAEHKSPAKGSYKHRNNSKFDPSVAEISSDPVEIRKQAILPRFLQNLYRS
jgi:hypothetical protein